MSTRVELVIQACQCDMLKTSKPIHVWHQNLAYDFLILDPKDDRKEADYLSIN